MTQIDLPRGASDHNSFMPQSVTAFKAGYSLAKLKTDALAGLTVAIVALPLSCLLYTSDAADE